MTDSLPRREFLKAVPAAAYAVAATSCTSSSNDRTAPAAVPANLPRPPALAPSARLEPFEFEGVRLLPSRWQRQVTAAREYYFSVADADILHGCRAAAGLSAPGRPLGGWCGVDSNSILGQWLSGMSRLARATGDAALRDKASHLFAEWAKTIRPDGDARMKHYAFDKIVGGLVDLQQHARVAEAVPVLARVTAFAAKTFDRPKLALADPSHNQHYYGLPQEWYTLGENLYRAYRLTGDESYRRFGDEWLYHAYWAKFESTASPADAHGVHAYSHTNSFSSAAMAYEVSGDPKYLAALQNGFDYLQQHQCYATGGFGPNERYMAIDGALGHALDTRSDTFETSCGSWAGFKMSRYLLQLTGAARYGDWIERLLYNAIGAALPVTERGRNFYYSDYRAGGGMKVYNWDTYTCCSGTYIQNVAEYHNLIYFRDARGLFVNLFLPSEVTWNGPAGSATDVLLKQETTYPDAETTRITVMTSRAVQFALRLRVPSWTRGFTVTVNGARAGVETQPGSWATIDRTWTAGDVVDVTIPLTLRMEPVNAFHPDRVAVVRGPVVLVLEGAYHDPNFHLPLRDEDLATWLVAEPGGVPRGEWATGLPPTEYATNFRVEPPDKRPVRLRFRPFYEIMENYPYFMYFDRRTLPWKLW
jgi:uncharacterized protein